MNPALLRSRLLEQAAHEGRQVLHAHATLYPALEVEAQLLEKSRDQMADIERAVLGLCSVGVGKLDEIAFAMGLKAHRLGPILMDIQYRGLIAQSSSSGIFQVTELGTLSHQAGVEMLRSTRALLLCGITGRLLPAPAYELERLSPADLRGRYSDRSVLQEVSEISLAHLHVSTIPNKRAVNLPDEVTAIEGVLAERVRPCFLDAVLEVSAASASPRASTKPERASSEAPCATPGGQALCKVYFGVPFAPAAWLSVEQALGLVEPFGYPRYRPEQLLALLAEDLEEQGAEGVRGALDPFGNPLVELASAAASLYRQHLDMGLVPFHIGAGEHAPVPIARYSLARPRGDGRDVLRGRTLRLAARPSTEFFEHIRVLRLVHETNVDGKKARATDAERRDRVHQALSQRGIQLEHARALLSKTGRADLLKLFE